MITLQEFVSLVLLSIGVLFMLLSSIGLVRFPDLYTRIHAAGKAGTLGIIGVLLGVAVAVGDLGVLLKLVALIAFFLVTAPIASHMLDRAAYLNGVTPARETETDQLAGRYDHESGRLA
jgi:multicomponent Na+:H+ antiporter subunit G